MTPLEMAVWGAAFARETNLNLKDAEVVRAAMRAADFSVALLRGGIEAERAQEALDDAKTKHRIRILQVNGIDTLRCSCGFQPRATESADIEEIMSIHLAAMHALGPEDVKEPA